MFLWGFECDFASYKLKQRLEFQKELECHKKKKRKK